MTFSPPQHPVDLLAPPDKFKIYYSRVVNLAVLSGLLTSDPGTEIGHFVFSDYYYEGIQLDRDLRKALSLFFDEHPDLVTERRAGQNQLFLGAVGDYENSATSQKINELILVGASLQVWPKGTSHTLTYPWDMDGVGRSVRFRPDLTDFMKRRIIEILRKAGKLRNPKLFSE
jgi:hypothetical protein